MAHAGQFLINHPIAMRAATVSPLSDSWVVFLCEIFHGLVGSPPRLWAGSSGTLNWRSHFARLIQHRMIPRAQTRRFHPNERNERSTYSC